MEYWTKGIAHKINLAVFVSILGLSDVFNLNNELKGENTGYFAPSPFLRK